MVGTKVGGAQFSVSLTRHNAYFMAGSGYNENEAGIVHESRGSVLSSPRTGTWRILQYFLHLILILVMSMLAKPAPAGGPIVGI